MLQRIARACAGLHACGVLRGDVHPRNVLVDEDRVRLFDFGMARMPPQGPSMSPDAGGLPWHGFTRGGVALFFEPVAARAALAEQPAPPPTVEGEQYAVAALLYYLLTGSHYLDFSLGRMELMRQIAEAPPVPLVGRGLPEWPSLEACLFRALSKSPGDRLASSAAFADALEAVDLPPAARPALSNDWLVALAAALEAPGEAAQPFFELDPW